MFWLVCKRVWSVLHRAWHARPWLLLFLSLLLLFFIFFWRWQGAGPCKDKGHASIDRQCSCETLPSQSVNHPAGSAINVDEWSLISGQCSQSMSLQFLDHLRCELRLYGNLQVDTSWTSNAPMSWIYSDPAEVHYYTRYNINVVTVWRGEHVTYDDCCKVIFFSSRRL